MLLLLLLLAQYVPQPQPSLSAELAVIAPQAEEEKQHAPRFSLTLTNTSVFPLQIVLPGDGSDCGWRTPVIHWEIVPEAGELLPPRFRGRCGMMNEPTLAETITLQPKERRTIDSLWSYPDLPGHGRFRVSVVYQNEPTLQFRNAPEGGEAIARMTRSHRVTARSNEVTVVVPGPPPPPPPGGELTDDELDRLYSCFWGEECTELQRRFARGVWQRCVSADAVAAYDAAIDRLLAERGLRRAKVTRVPDETPEGANVARLLGPAIVALDQGGRAFAVAPRGPQRRIALCSPATPENNGSTWGVWRVEGAKSVVDTVTLDLPLDTFLPDVSR